MAFIDARGTSNVISGDDDFLDFAWNAGVGANYSLTDTVDLSMGYRFVCFGESQCMAHDVDMEYDLTGGTPTAGDLPLDIDLMAHEFRVQVRVEVWSFVNPWF